MLFCFVCAEKCDALIQLDSLKLARRLDIGLQLLAANYHYQLYNPEGLTQAAKIGLFCFVFVSLHLLVRVFVRVCSFSVCFCVQRFRPSSILCVDFRYTLIFAQKRAEKSCQSASACRVLLVKA